MSLDRYRHPRLVVLQPQSTAYQAARAMVDNHVGAVLVADHGMLVGIVTDRDIALEIVAGKLDPATATLHDIMSDEVISLDAAAGVEDVLRVMQEHGVRRVPIVEEGRPAGFVTLDDLIIEGDIDVPAARSIIVAQLEAAARFKEAGETHPNEPARPGLSTGRMRSFARRMARVEHAYNRLLRAVELHTGLSDRPRAELALGIVLGALCRRVMPQEARHFIAQLPSKLQAELCSCLDGPDTRITTQTIEAELERQLGVTGDIASMLLSSICDAVADSVSAGEIESVRGQLPLSMKDLLPPTPLTVGLRRRERD